MATNLYIYEFKLSAWAPDTLPMARLVKYLEQLSVLFGHKDSVHFLKVVKGSAIPCILVDAPAHADVERRLRMADSAEASEDANRAYRQVNVLLREDGSSATLRLKGGAKVLEFKGAKILLAEEVVLFEQGELDGVVIRVGGRDATVPVHLEGENAQFFPCNTSRDIAKELARHLFGEPVRVAGRGKWRRTCEGVWELVQFDIHSFQPLDATPLDQAITKLRQVQGSDWNSLENPLQELKNLRGN